ncbi:MAG: 3-deoxy-7-phosphoheptulonate synthase, partial [Halioglobus sp.]|nr:3-deoxy-7-phosphoheptulonate synthase [Halioglobus sp.]
MSNIEIHNVNVTSQDILITPAQLKAALPMSGPVHDKLAESRQVIEHILDRKDYRLFVVVGPCAIHD